jgi:hypothetical protein
MRGDKRLYAEARTTYLQSLPQTEREMDFQYGTANFCAEHFHNTKNAAHPFTATSCPVVYEKDGVCHMFLSLKTTTKITKFWWPLEDSRRVEVRTEMAMLPLEKRSG